MQPPGDLQNARIECGRDESKRWRIECWVGVHELCVVEDVEPLETQLQAASLSQKGDPEVLGRITNVESYSVAVPVRGATPPKMQRYAVTQVSTDAGTSGTSFIGCPRDVLEGWVKPTLVGQDLFAVDRHLKRLQMQRGESGVQSWSGVEHAMWDAIGKLANRPVAHLLGGARDRQINP